MLDASILDVYLVNNAGQLVGRPILTLCVDACNFLELVDGRITLSRCHGFKVFLKAALHNNMSFRCQNVLLGSN